MPHSQELSNNPYPEANQHNSSRNDTYFFNILSIIIPPSSPRRS
jgi:hypothetical protein